MLLHSVCPQRNSSDEENVNSLYCTANGFDWMKRICFISFQQQQRLTTHQQQQRLTTHQQQQRLTTHQQRLTTHQQQQRLTTRQQQ